VAVLAERWALLRVAVALYTQDEAQSAA